MPPAATQCFLPSQFYPFQTHSIASLAYIPHSKFCNFLSYIFSELSEGMSFLSFFFFPVEKLSLAYGSRASRFTPKQRLLLLPHTFLNSILVLIMALNSKAQHTCYLPISITICNDMHSSCFCLSCSQKCFPSESSVCSFTMCHDVSPQT